MINLRSVLVALVAGSLLLLTVGFQAGALETDADSLAVAQRGLARGMAAAEEIAVDAEDGILVSEDVGHALAVLEAVMERFEARGNGNGRGPERAIEVHQALLLGELPASIGDNERAPGLAKAYGHMRAQLKGEGRNPNAATKGPRAPAP